MSYSFYLTISSKIINQLWFQMLNSYTQIKLVATSIIIAFSVKVNTKDKDKLTINYKNKIVFL